MKSTASKILLVSSVGVVAVFAILLFRSHKPKVAQGTGESEVSAKVKVAATNSPPATPSGDVANLKAPAPFASPQTNLIGNSPAVPEAASSAAAKSKEQTSLDHFAGSFFEYTQKSRDPKKLIRDLEQAGLKPVVTQNFNPDTGKMLIVRTGEALPGTRYFHAQFFEDENKQPYLQHMSFEFRPGPDAMDKAVKAVESQFPGLGKPSIKNADYIQWQTKNDYIVWVKRMSAEDLKDDPFNAHTKADAGTIKAAVEQEVHDHEDDSHVH